MTSAVIVSLRVRATPEEAFDVFTRDIGQWWRPNKLFQITPRGDGALRFVGEEKLITTLESGMEFEIGEVTDWSPGERLAFTWRQATFAPEQSTHVTVRFEPVEDETRVTVEHRGWDAIPREHAARHSFPLDLFQIRLGENWRSLLGEMSARLAVLR